MCVLNVLMVHKLSDHKLKQYLIYEQSVPQGQASTKDVFQSISFQSEIHLLQALSTLEEDMNHKVIYNSPSILFPAIPELQSLPVSSY